MARACVLIGYLAGIKAYKLLNIETNKTFVSRDLIFHESICHLIQPSTTSNDVSHLLNDDVLPSHTTVLPLPCDDLGQQFLISQNNDQVIDTTLSDSVSNLDNAAEHEILPAIT